jgi:hypothetical protein
VPLASGLLSGKFRPNTTFATDDVRQNFLTPKRLEEVIRRVDEVKSIIGRHRPRVGGGERCVFVLARRCRIDHHPGMRNVRRWR